MCIAPCPRDQVSIARARAAGAPTAARFLRDERGSSIVIALVFFLVCAVIGSVVLTAASVQAKSVQTHRDLQQAEFTVGSAAQTVAHELETAVLACGTSPTDKPSFDYDATLPFARDFWDQNGQAIMQARSSGQSITFGGTAADRITIEAAGGSGQMDVVYATITISSDLDVTVLLSLDRAMSADSDYNLTVTLQCVPAYDSAGVLTAFSYEPAVVQKTGGSQ